MSFFIQTTHKQQLADLYTPIGIFLKIRDKFPNSVILESADYHSQHNSFSYIACDPVASFVLDQGQVTQTFPDGTTESFALASPRAAAESLRQFVQRFVAPKQTFGFISNGLFGHITYDSVAYFEDIEIQPKSQESAIPQMVYYVYRYVVAINHFKDEMHLFAHHYGQSPEEQAPNHLETLEMLLNLPHYPTKPFRTDGPETSNLSDEALHGIIEKCIGHCLRGDVFQIVPSRRFAQPFAGDDFNVYRALRSINPSPYLFYFDFGKYHIFGSSPEAQIRIQAQQAEIHPIAGTFRRSGDDAKDAELAQQLHADPKESAEHVMLVDLARNDLSRSSEKVQVEVFKEVQFYSHVIHLVSKVTGQMLSGTNPLQLVADTFPAGTLSGAPKHNAMTLINRYEPTNRSIYGGAIGFMDFEGNFNHAIAIRTFLSKNNTLFFQAGMGVVAKSVIANEMQEVHNKLAALRKAIELAQQS
jgi:anthranilate synthase component I